MDHHAKKAREIQTEEEKNEGREREREIGETRCKNF